VLVSRPARAAHSHRDVDASAPLCSRGACTQHCRCRCTIVCVKCLALSTTLSAVNADLTGVVDSFTRRYVFRTLGNAFRSNFLPFSERQRYAAMCDAARARDSTRDRAACTKNSLRTQAAFFTTPATDTFAAKSTTFQRLLPSETTNVFHAMDRATTRRLQTNSCMSLHVKNSSNSGLS
jgi:hypothetical protein